MAYLNILNSCLGDFWKYKDFDDNMFMFGSHSNTTLSCLCLVVTVTPLYQNASFLALSLWELTAVFSSHDEF